MHCHPEIFRASPGEAVSVGPDIPLAQIRLSARVNRAGYCLENSQPASGQVDDVAQVSLLHALFCLSVIAFSSLIDIADSTCPNTRGIDISAKTVIILLLHVLSRRHPSPKPNGSILVWTSSCCLLHVWKGNSELILLTSSKVHMWKWLTLSDFRTLSITQSIKSFVSAEDVTKVFYQMLLIQEEVKHLFGTISSGGLIHI